MKMSGEEFSKKLRTLSDDTLRLIMECEDTSSMLKAAITIVKENESEEMIVKKLLRLKETEKK